MKTRDSTEIIQILVDCRQETEFYKKGFDKKIFPERNWEKTKDEASCERQHALLPPSFLRKTRLHQVFFTWADPLAAFPWAKQISTRPSKKRGKCSPPGRNKNIRKDEEGSVIPGRTFEVELPIKRLHFIQIVPGPPDALQTRNSYSMGAQDEDLMKATGGGGIFSGKARATYHFRFKRRLILLHHLPLSSIGPCTAARKDVPGGMRVPYPSPGMEVSI